MSLQAQAFIEDSNGPRLLNYTLDLTKHELSMFFDDPVDVSTMDARQITFQGQKITYLNFLEQSLCLKRDSPLMTKRLQLMGGWVGAGGMGGGGQA